MGNMATVDELSHFVDEIKKDIEKYGGGYNELAKPPIEGTLLCIRCSQELVIKINFV